MSTRETCPYGDLSIPMNNRLLVTLLIILSSNASASAFLFELPKGYNKNEPDDFPVSVELSFSISEIIDIDDIQNAISLQGSLTMVWRDTRVKVNLTNPMFETIESNLSPDEKTKFWTPDVWVANLRDFKLIKSYEDQATFTITKEKELRLWQSVEIKTSCPMHFQFYPFDTQKCTLQFSANGLDYSMQRFSGAIKLADPFHVSQGALQFQNIRLEQDPRDSYKTSESKRVWPQIQATFCLERRKLDHILQTFLPTGCVVCMSWISFLIPPYIVPGRMVLLVTLLLVVFSTYQSEHQRAPRSSSLKALDVWYVGCMLFVLAAICEYAIQLFLKRLIIRKKRLEEKEEKELEEDHKHDRVNLVKDLFLSTIGSRSNSNPDDGPEFGVKVGKSTVRIPATAMTQRYKSASTTAHRVRVSPVPESGGHRDETKPNDPVLDSGSEYGDINETDVQGEALLERIDETAFKVFPCCFLIYNIVYWINYLLRDNIDGMLS